MALVFADLVEETTTTTGTGSYTLAGAATGFQSFSAGIGTSNETFYAVTDGTNWEVSRGTLSDGTTLTRATVLDSSNSGSAVNWTAGTRRIYAVAPADIFSQTPAADRLVWLEDVSGNPGLPAVDGSQLTGLSAGRPVEAKAGAYTVIAGDSGKVLSCTGSFTLTLTAAGTLGNGYVFGIVNAGTGVITIDPDGAELIDGVTTLRVYPGERFDVICTSTGWLTVGRSRSMIVVQDVTITTPVASIEFTGLTDDFDQYLLVAQGGESSGNGNVYIRTSANGGASYNAGATEYRVASNDASYISLLQFPASSSDYAGAQVGRITFANIGKAARCFALREAAYVSTGAGNSTTSAQGGVRQATEIVNALQVIDAEDTITSGRFTLFGVVR